jgi:phosphoglucomutase
LKIGADPLGGASVAYWRPIQLHKLYAESFRRPDAMTA